MTFLHRYETDPFRPTIAEAGTDLLRRTLLPAVGLWVAIVAIGLLITGPLDALPAEVGVNEA